MGPSPRSIQTKTGVKNLLLCLNDKILGKGEMTNVEERERSRKGGAREGFAFTRG